MKVLSPGLSDHLSGTVTTLCTCWKVVRDDGTVLGFTDHDRDVSFDSTSYEAQSGFTKTALDQSSGLSVDNGEVAGALQSDQISEDDIRADRYDNARVEIYLVNWSEPSERLLQRVATIGELTEEDGAFRAELRSLSSGLDRAFGRYFNATCDAELGDARCGFDTSAPGYSAVGSVVTVSGVMEIIATDIPAFDNRWFAHGNLVWTSGANVDVSTMVTASRFDNGQSVLGLWRPMPAQIASGDTFDLTAGCDKSFVTCGGKFSNRINFQGFPHMPGEDTVFAYPASGDIHDGSPLVR